MFKLGNLSFLGRGGAEHSASDVFDWYKKAARHCFFFFPASSVIEQNTKHVGDDGSLIELQGLEKKPSAV